MTARNKFILTGEWLQELLTGLKDNEDKTVFKKVLLGYDKDKIRAFGDGVIATCYVTGVPSTNETLSKHNRPEYLNGFIAFIIKGSNEAKYKKAAHIMDLIHEKYEHDKTWWKLETPERVVRDTDLVRSELSLAPSNNNLDIVGSFELRHHVYK